MYGSRGWSSIASMVSSIPGAANYALDQSKKAWQNEENSRNAVRKHFDSRKPQPSAQKQPVTFTAETAKLPIRPISAQKLAEYVVQIKGRIREPNDKNAILLSKARPEDARLLYHLALSLHKGELGFEVSKKIAFELLFQLAEDMRYPPAQYYLGLIVESGDGVSSDFREAANYFSAAAFLGVERGKLELDKLRKKHNQRIGFDNPLTKLNECLDARDKISATLSSCQDGRKRGDAELLKIFTELFDFLCLESDTTHGLSLIGIDPKQYDLRNKIELLGYTSVLELEIYRLNLFINPLRSIRKL